MPTATRPPAPLPPHTVPMFLESGQMTREWYLWLKSVDDLLRAIRVEVSALIP